MAIDSTDTKILNALLENSRASFREVAKKVGVSVVTVLKRVKELEKQKIITGYTANIDYEKLGYEFHIAIKLRISKGKLFEVEGKLAKDHRIVSVYDLTGDFDSLVIARFKNRRSMDTFLKKIQKYDFVERTQTSLILNAIKEGNIRVE